MSDTISIEIKSLISKQKLQEAFIAGLDEYIKLYEIQSNKSYLNEKVTSIAHIGYSLYHISNSKYERALAWKRRCMLADNSLANCITKIVINFFELEAQKKKRPLTSMAVMVLSSILFNAVNLNFKRDSCCGYNLTLVLYRIAKLNTAAEIDTSSYIDKLNQLLIKKQFVNNENKQVFLSDLPELQKSQYMFYSLFSKIDKAKLFVFFSEEQLVFFEKVIPVVCREKPVSGFSEDDQRIKDFILICRRFATATSEYIKKFDEKDSNRDKSYEFIVDDLAGYAISYIPDIPIIDLGKNILRDLASLAIKTKGYGIIHRHGTSGQIRAYLLKIYIQKVLTIVLSKYQEYLHGGYDDKGYADIEDLRAITSYIDFFIFSFKQMFKCLPNKNQHGSLAFYISMFCDPESNPFGMPNKEKIKKWEANKLKKGIIERIT